MRTTWVQTSLLLGSALLMLGCSTTLVWWHGRSLRDRNSTSLVYEGTRLDLHMIANFPSTLVRAHDEDDPGLGVLYTFLTLFCLVDTPLSLAADTVLLPFAWLRDPERRPDQELIEFDEIDPQ